MKTKELIQEQYGYIFEQELIQEIVTCGLYKEVLEGEFLMDIGERVTHMPLLLSGSIKILRQDEEGDDLFLYYIEKGDTCAMTLTCCMGHKKSEIRAEAEKDSVLIFIPVEKMDEWIKKYASWRNFVFESYNNRFNELLEAIDSLAFMNMHDRVMRYLREKVMANSDPKIMATHQQIANDLHSSRVVMSRVLKSLETEGKIKLHRNWLEITHF